MPTDSVGNHTPNNSVLFIMPFVHREKPKLLLFCGLFFFCKMSTKKESQTAFLTYYLASLLYLSDFTTEVMPSSVLLKAYCIVPKISSSQQRPAAELNNTGCGCIFSSRFSQDGKIQRNCREALGQNCKKRNKRIRRLTDKAALFYSLI